MKKNFHLLIILLTLIFLFSPANAETHDSNGYSTNHPKHSPTQKIIYEKGVTRYSVTPTAPPTAPVRMCAEWERVNAVLVRYPLGLPWDMLQDVAQQLEIKCLVSSSDLSSAQSDFSSHGITNVSYVVTNTNSYWTRDYGPWGVFDGNGDYGISDHVYNRADGAGRTDDDQSNWDLAPALGVQLWKTELRHTGGNFMTDGHGIGFSSDEIYDYTFNNTISHDSVNTLMKNYWGITNYHTYTDPLGSYINHIDCYGKLLSDEVVLIIRNGVDDSALDAIADSFENTPDCYGRPYRVYRVNAPDNHNAAYCNSVILNNRVYVPLTGYSNEDDSAIAVYQSAMPGYDIIGINDPGGSIAFENTDAIHCRTMGLFDPGMLFIDHKPLGDQSPTAPNYHLDAFIKAYSDSSLKSDSLLIFWRLKGNSTFNTTTLTYDSTNYYSGNIPGQTSGSTVEYYIYAVDNSGRHEADPLVAPAGYYTFHVGDQPPSISHTPITDFLYTNWPATVIATITDEGAVNTALVEYIHNDTTYYDTMVNTSGNTYETDFGISVNVGDSISYRIKAQDNTGNIAFYPDSGYITFHIIDKINVGIIDLDPTPSTGPLISSYCDSVCTYRYLTSFPSDLSLYNNLFICLGVYSNNTTLSSTQASNLVNFMNNGGNVYMEGGDCWYYDASHSVYDTSFGVNPISDGSTISYDLTGVSSTFTNGMSFSYNGDNNYIDEIGTTGSGYLIFNENGTGRAVANDTSGYKSVAFTFELGGLVDGSSPSTKDSLIRAIFDFFGVTSGIKENSVSKKQCTEFSVKSRFYCREIHIELLMSNDNLVNISLYDISGKKIGEIYNGQIKSGKHHFTMNVANKITNGIYFVTAKSKNHFKSSKILIVK